MDSNDADKLFKDVLTHSDTTFRDVDLSEVLRLFTRIRDATTPKQRLQTTVCFARTVEGLALHMAQHMGLDMQAVWRVLGTGAKENIANFEESGLSGILRGARALRQSAALDLTPFQPGVEVDLGKDFLIDVDDDDMVTAVSTLDDDDTDTGGRVCIPDDSRSWLSAVAFALDLPDAPSKEYVDTCLAELNCTVLTRTYNEERRLWEPISPTKSFPLICIVSIRNYHFVRMFAYNVFIKTFLQPFAYRPGQRLHSRVQAPYLTSLGLRHGVDYQMFYPKDKDPPDLDKIVISPSTCSIDTTTGVVGFSSAFRVVVEGVRQPNLSLTWYVNGQWTDCIRVRDMKKGGLRRMSTEFLSSLMPQFIRETDKYVRYSPLPLMEDAVEVCLRTHLTKQQKDNWKQLLLQNGIAYVILTEFFEAPDKDQQCLKLSHSFVILLMITSDGWSPVAYKDGGKTTFVIPRQDYPQFQGTAGEVTDSLPYLPGLPVHHSIQLPQLMKLGLLRGVEYDAWYLSREEEAKAGDLCTLEKHLSTCGGRACRRLRLDDDETGVKYRVEFYDPVHIAALSLVARIAYVESALCRLTHA
jgi:hypothetical protein